ncbi:MAG: oxidoreductase [Moraxellaceae bacterium]
MTRWTQANLPDLSGKLAVVTGANSGLGMQTARALATRGATVVMACRNAEKAASAADAIRRDIPAAQLDVRALDLASLVSVKAFADTLLSAGTGIDLLINNAGLMAVPFARTADGFEMQMGTNHLGHFALTGHLLPALKSGGRIVALASVAHIATPGINLDDLNWEKRRYQRWIAYGDSKLANLMYAFELARRLQRHNKALNAVAAHPGYSDTNLQYVASDVRQSAFERIVWRAANGVMAQKAELGALPTLRAATDTSIKNGDYVGPDSLFGLRGYPVKVGCRRLARNEEIAQQLWEVSEKLTGVKYLP